MILKQTFPIVFLFILSIWLAVCQNNELITESLINTPTTQYSPLTEPDQSSLSPVNAPISVIENNTSPISKTLVSKISPEPFHLEKPIFEGDTLLRGLGPPNVPIRVVDVTFMGRLLTAGQIDSSGKFELPVSSLEAGHRLGLMLGNLSGTNLSQQDFRDAAFFGEEAMMVPEVGFFFDTAMVRSKK